MSLGVGITNNEYINIINTKISDRTEGEDTGTLFQIIFLQGWGRGMCGGAVEGEEILCTSLVREYNIVSHTRSRGSVEDIPGVKEGTCVVIDPSSPRSPSYDFFQPVLSGATASNVKSFEGLLLLAYTLGGWGEIFQVLEVEAQKKLMMFSEGIRRSKVEVINMTNPAMSFTELFPLKMSLSGGEDTIAWLRKWNHCD